MLLPPHHYLRGCLQEYPSQDHNKEDHQIRKFGKVYGNQTLNLTGRRNRCMGALIFKVVIKVFHGRIRRFFNNALFTRLIFNGNVRRVFIIVFFKWRCNKIFHGFVIFKRRLSSFFNKIFFVYHTIHSLDMFNIGPQFFMIIWPPFLARCFNKTCKR
jgi:hypothetical protein